MVIDFRNAISIKECYDLKNLPIWVCCLSTARCNAVWRLTFCRSIFALPTWTNSSATYNEAYHFKNLWYWNERSELILSKDVYKLKLKVDITSTWLFSEARWRAVYPSSFFSSTIHGLVSLERRTLMALKNNEYWLINNNLNWMLF